VIKLFNTRLFEQRACSSRTEGLLFDQSLNTITTHVEYKQLLRFSINFFAGRAQLRPAARPIPAAE
jgi:hypothetical protein